MARNTVDIDELWRALDACCTGGYEKKLDKKREYWRVTYLGVPFFRLPSGGHGHRRDAEVFAGTVRSMVSPWGIEECIEMHLPGLFPKLKKQKAAAAAKASTEQKE